MIDAHRKYNFKAKKRKVAEEEEDLELEESVRTISALLQSGGTVILPGMSYADVDDPMDPQVADIRAEIAAAIAQAHSQVYDEDEDEEGDVEAGQEVAVRPNTSGIRSGEANGDGDETTDGMVLNDEAEDSDAFPIPLRTRRPRESAPQAVIGTKRKR